MTKDPTFRPADVERLAGVDNDTQRDWRRRGFLEEFGESLGSSGRWTYSLHDIIAFYVAKRLTESGMDRGEASAVGAVHSGTVKAFIQERPPAYRYVARVLDRAEGQQPERFERFIELKELEETTFDRAEVIDLWSLATTAPDDLVELVRLYTPQEPAD